MKEYKSGLHNKRYVAFGYAKEFGRDAVNELLKYFILYNDSNYFDLRKPIGLGYDKIDIPVMSIEFKDNGSIIILYGETSVKKRIVLNKKPKSKQKNEESEMNEQIIKLFPKTEDAVLVQKYFGTNFNNPFLAIMLEGKEDKVLAMAKEADAAAKAKS